MGWFYAKDGQKTGPVPESTLHELVRTEALSADALVWREGMEKWLPFSVFFPPKPAAIPQHGQGRCVLCEKIFPAEELLRYDSNFVCGVCKPVFFQKLREGVGAQPVEAWRSGKFLITRYESRLPDRCVKCNAPAHGRTLVRKLNWHPWWALLPAAFGLLLPVAGLTFFRGSRAGAWLGPLVFFVFIGCMMSAALIRRRADVYVGLCDEHWQRYRRDTAIVGVTTVVSVVAFIAGVNVMKGNAVWIAFGFIGIFVAGVIYGAVRTPLVRTKKMTKEFIWLRGASPKFLAELPEFTVHR